MNFSFVFFSWVKIPFWCLGWVSVFFFSLSPAWGQTPTYTITAKLNPENHSIEGEVRVDLEPGDLRAGKPLVFHLPVNRFAAEDPRGKRWVIRPIPITVEFAQEDPVDPLAPYGLGPGKMEVLWVRNAAGEALAYTIDDNPQLPQGFFTEKTLLRVKSPASSLTIGFRSHLPERHWEGWDGAGIAVENWYPVLLPFQDDQWMMGFNTLGPGRYWLKLESTTPGWVGIAKEGLKKINPGAPLNLIQGALLRTVPLVFRPEWKGDWVDGGAFKIRMIDKPGVSLNKLAALHTMGFVGFMIEKGFPLPAKEILLVHSATPTGEPWVSGSMVFLPDAYYKNSVLLDRIFLGKLYRALAALWLGENIWDNTDTGSWLRYGLAGFYALSYYEKKFGWDGGIHSLVDWLNPKYREHFFEARTRKQIRSERDLPLTFSWKKTPLLKDANAAALQKGPLVFRTLHFVMGEEAFAEGMRIFFPAQRHQTGSLEVFQQAMEKAYGHSLDWFFSDWVRGITKLDYKLADWKTKKTEAGFEVEVKVLRLTGGRMPLEVAVETKDGKRLIQRWEGVESEKTLVFQVKSPLKKIVLDPFERLLELNRKNNYSKARVRLRLFFDWAKQRDNLMTVVGTVGGNAVDGNIVGGGVNLVLDEGHNLSVIPIYSQLREKYLHEILYEKAHFLRPDSILEAIITNVGGKISQSVGLRVHRPKSGGDYLETTFQARQEKALSLSANSVLLQEAGKTNNLRVIHEGRFNQNKPVSLDYIFKLEGGGDTLGSDFAYTTLEARFGQRFHLGARQMIRTEFVAGKIKGQAPLQKKHLLGDPTVMRGFPRGLDLVSDNIAAVRLEYHLVVTRAVIGSLPQSRRLALFLFTDAGKGWDNTELYRDAPLRRDAGFGFTMKMNFLEMVEFPFRMEIAYPLNDPDYTRPQIILLEALSFF